MADPLPTVSVIIPTRDRPKVLERALSSVLADQATMEVLVVIDGEDAKTEDLLRRHQQSDPRVRFTHTPAPDDSGLNSVQRGRDHGVRSAKSEVILAFDDDEVAHPGMVTGHARWHARRDDLVVVGYVPVVTPRRWPHSHAPVRFYASAYESDIEIYRSDPDSILRGLWGGNTSVRRSHWLEAIEAGRTECYQDDRQLGLLLLRQGLEGVFDPSLRADHWYERTLRGFVGRAQKTVLAQVELRAAYPELVEPGEPWEKRRTHDILLAVTRPSAGWFVVRWGLIAATTLAGVLRLRKLEDFGARALWRVACERAAAGV